MNVWTWKSNSIFSRISRVKTSDCHSEICHKCDTLSGLCPWCHLNAIVLIHKFSQHILDLHTKATEVFVWLLPLSMQHLVICIIFDAAPLTALVDWIISALKHDWLLNQEARVLWIFLAILLVLFKTIKFLTVITHRRRGWFKSPLTNSATQQLHAFTEDLKSLPVSSVILRYVVNTEFYIILVLVYFRHVTVVTVVCSQNVFCFIC